MVAKSTTSCVVLFIVVGLAAADEVPGGVLDPSGKTIYVQNPKGGVDAVAVETGKIVWQSAETARPLAVAGTHLVVQVPDAAKANRVAIAILDTAAKGKILKTSDPIVFPDWVSVRVTHGRSFGSTARADKGDLLLEWQARAWYAGGARPTPEIEKAARKEAHGLARVNLESGKVEMLAADKTAADTPLPKDLKDIKSHQYWTGADWKQQPIVAGKKVAALAVETVDGKLSKLVLKRWDLATGQADEPVALLTGKALWLQVSLDRRHLFVHQALVKEQLPKGDHAWWVFSLETGKQLAKIPYETATPGISLMGERIYYVTETSKLGPRGGTRTRTLKAVDAKTGELAWDYSIWAPPVLLPLP
jgi:hypothetical protein